MSDTKQVSAQRIFSALGEVEPSQSGALAKVIKEYELSEELLFSRDTYGDGTISIPYIFNNASQSIPGLLRFREDGAILDGRQTLKEFRLSPLTAHLLIASLFGEEELTKPLSENERTFVQATKRIVDGEPVQSVHPLIAAVHETIRTRKVQESLETCLQKKQSMIAFAHNMLKVAAAEDEGPGGWNPKDFSPIVGRYTAWIATDQNSIQGCESSIQKASDMLLESAKTWSGARACVRLGGCRVETKGCGAGYEGETDNYYTMDNEFFSQDGISLRSDGSCTAKDRGLDRIRDAK